MKIKVCPKCGSKDVDEVKEGGFPDEPYFLYGAPIRFKCNGCGFVSYLFPETESKEGGENKLKFVLAKYKKYF